MVGQRYVVKDLCFFPYIAIIYICMNFIIPPVATTLKLTRSSNNIGIVLIGTHLNVSRTSWLRNISIKSPVLQFPYWWIPTNLILNTHGALDLLDFVPRCMYLHKEDGAVLKEKPIPSIVVFKRIGNVTWKY